MAKAAKSKLRERAAAGTGTAAAEHVQSDSRDAQLAQLEAHGNAFLASFGLQPTASTSAAATTSGSASSEHDSKKRKNKKQKPTTDEDPTTTTTSSSSSSSSSSQADPIHQVFSAATGSSSAAPAGAAAAAAAAAAAPKPSKPKSRPIETVVFSSPSASPRGPDPMAKKGWKAFMSSKIEKIGKEEELAEEEGKDEDKGEDEEEEEQLETNDRLLSKLLSTTLFAPDSEGSKKLSSNETLARILELSASETKRNGTAIGRGWGQAELKRRELSKMPAAHRAGIRRAAGERRDKEREKAKELGTWHQSTKQQYASQSTALERGTKKETRKRQRGIGVGIGKFQGGQLKLSARDVEKINGPPSKASKASKASDGKAKSGPSKKRKR